MSPVPDNEAQYRRSEALQFRYRAGIAIASVPFIQRMLDAEALVKTLVGRIEALEQAQRGSIPPHLRAVERRTV